MKNQIIIFSFFVFFQFVSSQSDQLNLEYSLCRRSDNISSTSPYTANKFSLFLNLSALSSHSWFSNFSSGSGLNQVNGLYLCRPDLPLELCQACVEKAISTQLLGRCIVKKEAISFYDECMVRYTNRTIFAALETKISYNTSCSSFSVSDQDIFPALLNSTMQELITKAVSLPAGEIPFAFKSANFTLFEGLYGMMLCTPDITRKECKDCLTIAYDLISTCGEGWMQYTKVLLPSCQLRYDTAPFIFTPVPAAFAPSLAPA